MGWIITLIKLLPEIIALIKECVGLVESAAAWVDKKQKLGEFTQAVKVARETKDTSKLEAIFSGKPTVSK